MRKNVKKSFGSVYSYVKFDFNAGFFAKLFLFQANRHLKKMARVNGRVKYIKKMKNGKKSLFEVRFGFPRCLFGGFGG